MSGQVARHAQPIAEELLGGFRALVVNGPRQAGKSTFMRHIQRSRGPVVTLDDATLRDVALNDPTTFINSLTVPVAIDEFQRGGDALLLALKVALDAQQRKGDYLLAGSTRFLTTRTLSETLTGRVGIMELLPLSAGELRTTRESFLDCVFNGALGRSPEQLTRRDYAAMISTGGFPELVLGAPSSRFRRAWCESYLQTVTAVANIEQVADIRRPETMRGLLTQLAARSSQELVATDLARELTIDTHTVASYVDVMSTLYLVRVLPAWTTSLTNRSKRRSVIHFVDSALAAHVLGSSGDQLAQLDSPWMGPLLESFVVGELAKQATWNDETVHLAHYRDRDQREVDVIIERGRDIVGIEVKATATPTTAHAKHLAYVRDRLGERFKLGVVLHTGSHVVSLGDRLVAAPVSQLWA
jgi:uncharacterized protein